MCQAKKNKVNFAKGQYDWIIIIFIDIIEFFSTSNLILVAQDTQCK